ncbi:hypothetical protein TL16_g00978 [Triparma laevis f. inornata]|uniref:WW domain-containing protein n=1 Tax=Triparma laevis f. inornata TaxID=1714386 RepID=A0A9W7DR61_9STRA|nr:hypothetical protein TL16_g00978 [Triparma laevis f. inornata]
MYSPRTFPLTFLSFLVFVNLPLTLSDPNYSCLCGSGLNPGDSYLTLSASYARLGSTKLVDLVDKSEGTCEYTDDGDGGKKNLKLCTYDASLTGMLEDSYYSLPTTGLTPFFTEIADPNLSYTSTAGSTSRVKLRYIELWNPNYSEYSLSGHSVKRWNEGTTTGSSSSNPNLNFDTSAVIPAQDFYIICKNKEAFDSKFAPVTCDKQHPVGDTATGNDFFEFKKDGVIVDQIGDPADSADTSADAVTFTPGSKFFEKGNCIRTWGTVTEGGSQYPQPGTHFRSTCGAMPNFSKVNWSCRKEIGEEYEFKPKQWGGVSTCDKMRCSESKCAPLDSTTCSASANTLGCVFAPSSYAIHSPSKIPGNDVIGDQDYGLLIGDKVREIQRGCVNQDYSKICQDRPNFFGKTFSPTSLFRYYGHDGQTKEVPCSTGAKYLFPTKPYYTGKAYYTDGPWMENYADDSIKEEEAYIDFFSSCCGGEVEEDLSGPEHICGAGTWAPDNQPFSLNGNDPSLFDFQYITNDAYKSSNFNTCGKLKQLLFAPWSQGIWPGQSYSDTWEAARLLTVGRYFNVDHGFDVPSGMFNALILEQCCTFNSPLQNDVYAGMCDLKNEGLGLVPRLDFSTLDFRNNNNQPTNEIQGSTHPLGTCTGYANSFIAGSKQFTTKHEPTSTGGNTDAVMAGYTGPVCGEDGDGGIMNWPSAREEMMTDATMMGPLDWFRLYEYGVFGDPTSSSTNPLDVNKCAQTSSSTTSCEDETYTTTEACVWHDIRCVGVWVGDGRFRGCEWDPAYYGGNADTFKGQITGLLDSSQVEYYNAECKKSTFASHSDCDNVNLMKPGFSGYEARGEGDRLTSGYCWTKFGKDSERQGNHDANSKCMPNKDADSCGVVTYEVDHKCKPYGEFGAEVKDHDGMDNSDNKISHPDFFDTCCTGNDDAINHYQECNICTILGIDGAVANPGDTVALQEGGRDKTCFQLMNDELPLWFIPDYTQTPESTCDQDKNALKPAFCGEDGKWLTQEEKTTYGNGYADKAWEHMFLDNKMADNKCQPKATDETGCEQSTFVREGQACQWKAIECGRNNYDGACNYHRNDEPWYASTFESDGYPIDPGTNEPWSPTAVGPAQCDGKVVTDEQMESGTDSCGLEDRALMYCWGGEQSSGSSCYQHKTANACESSTATYTYHGDCRWYAPLGMPAKGGNHDSDLSIADRCCQMPFQKPSNANSFCASVPDSVKPGDLTFFPYGAVADSSNNPTNEFNSFWEPAPTFMGPNGFNNKCNQVFGFVGDTWDAEGLVDDDGNLQRVDCLKTDYPAGANYADACVDIAKVCCAASDVSYPTNGNSGWINIAWEAQPTDVTANPSDVLKFQVSPDHTHNIYRMESEAKFNECNFEGALKYLDTLDVSGMVALLDWIVPPFNAGKKLFFASKVGSDCANGLKMQVTVGEGADDTGGGGTDPDDSACGDGQPPVCDTMCMLTMNVEIMGLGEVPSLEALCTPYNNLKECYETSSTCSDQDRAKTACVANRACNPGDGGSTLPPCIGETDCDPSFMSSTTTTCDQWTSFSTCINDSDKCDASVEDHIQEELEKACEENGAPPTCALSSGCDMTNIQSGSGTCDDWTSFVNCLKGTDACTAAEEDTIEQNKVRACENDNNMLTPEDQSCLRGSTCDFSFLNTGDMTCQNLSDLGSCVEGKDSCSATTMCQAGMYTGNFGSTQCMECATNTFSSTAGAVSCTQCPSGKTSGVGSYTCEGGSDDTTGPTTCPAGRFTDGSDCKPCPKGEFSGTAGSDECNRCPAGTYVATTGATQCISCPAGKSTADSVGMDSCLMCPDGAFTSYAGSPDCTQCESRKTSASGRTDCKDVDETAPCSAGRFREGEQCKMCMPGSYSSVTGSIACNQCATGTFSSEPGSTECNNCPSGKVSGVGAAGCDRTSDVGGGSGCAAGTFVDADNVCAPCQPGHFTSNTDSDYCNACPSGKFQALAGKDSCNNCPAGKSSNDGIAMTSCMNCPAGKFAGASGSAQCENCDTGKVSDAGAFGCRVEGDDTGGEMVCPAGMFKDSTNDGDCKHCHPGKYSSAVGSNVCTQCATNTYQDIRGSTSCKACEDGFTSAVGAGGCDRTEHGGDDGGGSSCPDGKMPGSGASDACVNCAIGSYSTGGDDCAMCPDGKFASSAGSAYCSVCAVGMFAGEPNSASCAMCPKNTYSSTTGATQCAPCQEGFFSLPGSSACEQCSPGKYHDEASNVCAECPQNTYAEAGAADVSGCLTCDVGGFSNPGSTACEMCGAGTAFNEASDQCVDCEAGQSSQNGENCATCDMGFVSTEAGSSECTPCEAGAYTSADQTELGKFSADAGSIQCEVCPENSISRAGDTGCQCRESFVSADNGECVCPEKTEFENGVCVALPPAPSPTPPKREDVVTAVVEAVVVIENLPELPEDKEKKDAIVKVLEATLKVALGGDDTIVVIISIGGVLIERDGRRLSASDEIVFEVTKTVDCEGDCNKVNDNSIEELIEENVEASISGDCEVDCFDAILEQEVEKVVEELGSEGETWLEEVEEAEVGVTVKEVKSLEKPKVDMHDQTGKFSPSKCFEEDWQLICVLPGGILAIALLACCGSVIWGGIYGCGSGRTNKKGTKSARDLSMDGNNFGANMYGRDSSGDASMFEASNPMAAAKKKASGGRGSVMADPNWVARRDPGSGDVYYEHLKTKLTTWDRPDGFIGDDQL